MQKPSDAQTRVIFLLLLLTFLAVARSPNVKSFFTNGFSFAKSGVQGKASSTPLSTLDWHLLLYWGVGAIILVALSDVAPTFVTILLLLIIMEEVLVHWSSYTALLSPPKK